MTDEEIKQNAEEYANTRKYTLDELNNSILTVEEIVRLSFIAGAHSRDVEIELLERFLKISSDTTDGMTNYIIKLREEIEGLKKK